MTIYFDMDGTIANLYSRVDWLLKLEAESVEPYAEAETLVNVEAFTALIENAKANGYKVGIISWLSKNSTPNYAKAVEMAKREWLAEKFPNIEWNKIHILPYGTKKAIFASANDILFDDEENNRTAWNGKAYTEKEIFKILEKI